MNMTNDDFIVAIELGSSKVTAIAGQKQPDGAIKVLAYAQDPSESFIRKGCINNFNKMTSCVDSIKQKLENALGRSVASCYVGIGGMGIHTVANTVTRHLGEKQLITAEMVNNVKDSNNSMPGNDREILEVIPQDYQLGTQVVADPIGIASDVIEGHFLNIISNTSVSESVYNCFRSAHLNVVGMPITVLALADAILTEPEKRSGCAFVDMGAETTSVAIFKNNLLRHLAVIPLGGANINRDITSLQVEDDEAEHLKLKFGAAVADINEDNKRSIQLHDGRSVDFNEFASLVEARMEEIILNINNQIVLSHYDKNQLIGGLIVTGGASHMKDIDKAFKRDTQFEKIRFVRNLKIQLRSADHSDFNNDGDCNAAIALLDTGDQNCCGGDLGNPNRDLFTDEKPHEEEIQQAEADAKRKAEAEAEAARKEAEEKAEAARKEEEEKRKAEKEAKKAKRQKFFKGVKSWLSNLVNDGSNDE